jgi:phage terminase large subunit-like protein
MIAAAQPDVITQRWMRDASDELAVRNGCWFDEERGQWVVDWLYDYLRLYEGEYAGQPFECRDWQYDATMRLFGWVRQSEEWGRVIRRFRKTSIWVAKKNKKSPTLAAWTVYLAFGDGEMGQKVFPTAKDGAQIRENVVRHIHEMILQSDQLAGECKINKTTGNVFHTPTRSLIMPLSSDNVATQKSKEGLNGSVAVDEVHVVDKQHMRRISRAGISRAEPIHMEVSTAGNEPESYGFGRFQYAQSIIDGRSEDDQTLAIIHAAPQNTKDSDIHADPLKFGKMANPSMGHTVKQSEFLADYTISRKSISEFADFKMYRLNIWQQSASPWLSVHDWAACPSVAGELPVGETTYAGLDLSRKIDLTAWVLFQPGDVPRCYGHYWCPRERAVELSSQFEIPLLDWAAQGWITLVDRRGIDYDAVIQRIEEDVLKYSISHIGFDPYNSDQVVKYCEDKLFTEMVEVRQGIPSLSAPTKELELLAVEHGLDHRCDPVLAWMIGNTSIRMDENGNIKPLKSVGGVWKHIDGVVSLIMAKYMATCNPDGGRSIYETPGALAL